MEPTISNAFNDGSTDSTGSARKPVKGWSARLPQDQFTPSQRGGRRSNPRKSLAASLSAMQVDLTETEFGWSLDLSPMHAIDVLQSLSLQSVDPIHYLITMEQSAWRHGDDEMPVGEIAQRLAIPVVAALSSDQIVMDEISLRQLVSLCQPSRLVVVAVEGLIDERDADAINKAIERGRSPLLAELRALAAIEVLGDRSLVLHCRDKAAALAVIAHNFRHYLAALNNTPADRFDAPANWQIERLLSLTGAMTIRPIETQRFSTSIDVGINTTKERFSQPADKSLIYDIPSNTWHDEP